jgi:nucleotide-binding universal stress UspA family protein
VYECILVPLDGSEAAEAALALTELIPSRRVRLLQVEPDEHGPMLVSAGEAERWRAARREEARAYLTQAGTPLRRQGRDVEAVFAFGDPADQIIAADVDLIVMATHGRGAGGRSFYGSVADRVVRHARVPTLIVRGGERPVAAPPLARVLVPFDGSPLAEAALPVAAELGDVLGLPLHLVQVVEEDLVRATVQAGPAVAAAAARRTAEVKRQAEDVVAAAVQALRNRDLAVTGEVRTGLPVTELLAAVRPADLVVMTTHGRGGVRRWLLGSVAEKLVRHAPAPVLLVRPGQASGNAAPRGGRTD